MPGLSGITFWINSVLRPPRFHFPSSMYLLAVNTVRWVPPEGTRNRKINLNFRSRARLSKIWLTVLKSDYTMTTMGWKEQPTQQSNLVAMDSCVHGWQACDRVQNLRFPRIGFVSFLGLLSLSIHYHLPSGFAAQPGLWAQGCCIN